MILLSTASSLCVYLEVIVNFRLEKYVRSLVWIQSKACDIISRIIRLILSLDEEIIQPDNLVETVNNITLIDYQSGYTTISVLDYNSVGRCRYFISDEASFHSEFLDGFVHTKITILTQNFSGKVKIEFRKTL